MNKWFIGLLFLFSTSLFLYQHSTGVSWDFSVFTLNSNYFLTGTGYFEIGRPPLASVLMFFGEYVYIILVSLLGLLACLKFAKTYSLKPEVFYSLILTPYVLFMGFQVGAEFLVLSLTLLLFSYIRNELSGFFLSLTILAQYRTAFNSLFLLFSGKKFFKSLFLAFLVFLPWFLFNYSLTGDPFYSMIDQYAKNVHARRYYDMPFNFDHLLFVSGFLLPLAIFGLCTSFKRDKLIDWLLILFFIVKVLSYITVPFKTHRYFFDLILPLAYFSARGLERFNYKVAFIILAVTIVSFSYFIPYFRFESPAKYLVATELVNDSCMVLSNSWVFLNYFGVNSGPAPLQNFVVDRLDKGYTLVFFKNVWDPQYVFNHSFMSNLPVTINTSDFFVVDSDSCLPSYDYNISFIEEVRTDDPGYNFTIWDIIS